MQNNEVVKEVSLPEKVFSLVNETTTILRKDSDPITSERKEGNLVIHEVLGFPTASETETAENTKTIDLVFFDVAVNLDKAENNRTRFKEIIDSYPEPDRLEGGISYIQIAGTIGVEQQTALSFMALGEVLGFWKIITGKTLELNEEESRELAGNGFIMTNGCKKD
jgi:hypothetical protein